MPPVVSSARTARLARLYAAVTTSPTENVNPRTEAIDQANIAKQLSMIHHEDAMATQAVEAALPQLAKLMEALLTRFQHAPETARLIYVGAGTSGRLGVLDSVECLPTFGIAPGRIVGVMAGGQVALSQAVEGAEDDAEQGTLDIMSLKLTSADTVVGISASGGAAYVQSALETAGKEGCLTGAIVNNPAAPLVKVADHTIILNTGAEAITGSTRMKAGTAQKMVLNMLSTVLMVNLGRTYGNVMVDVQPTNAKLRQRALRLTMALADVDELAALEALKACQYKVKQAVAMLVGHLSPEAAEAALSHVQGQLWQLLDDPKASGSA